MDASIEGKTVTLTGTAPSAEVKARVMQAFNELVETENTINRIRVEEAPKPEPAAAQAEAVVAEAPVAEAPTTAPAATPGEERWHVVASGDTLSGLAKKYYGKGSLYTKIFEANTDQLKDPNLIKVGQRLRIPHLPDEPMA